MVQAKGLSLLSDKYFTVDGRLIEARAGQNSFKPKTGGAAPPPQGGTDPNVNLQGEKDCNDMHQWTTDPEARLYKR